MPRRKIKVQATSYTREQERNRRRARIAHAKQVRTKRAERKEFDNA